MRTTDASRSSGRLRTIPKSLFPSPHAFARRDGGSGATRRRRSFSRRSNHALRPDTHTQITRSARTHDARRRRGEGSETEEKRRDRPDDARREAKQEGRAEFRRFARRGDVGPRAAGGAHVRHGGGAPSPRGSPPEVLLGVRVPVLLQLRAVRHALLQQEVQRRAHRDALSQVHGVNDAWCATFDCQLLQSNFFGVFAPTKNEKCRRGPFSRPLRTEKRRPPREARVRACASATPRRGTRARRSRRGGDAVPLEP